MGDEGGLVAIAASDLAFEVAIIAQIGPNGATHLAAFVCPVPVKVNAAGREPDHWKTMTFIAGSGSPA